MSVVADKVQQFFAAYPKKSWAKRGLLVSAGEEPSGVFYLEEGRVNQYDISKTGVEIVVNVFKPPAFFPMTWAINRVPNRYFFEAATNVVARQAPADEVVDFLKREPDVTFDLLSRVYMGSEGLLRRTAHILGGDATSRLIYELLNAAARFGQSQPDGSLLLSLKEADIARHSGLARETVNRAIQNLKASGVVTVTRQGITVRSIGELEKLLGDNL